MRSKLDAVTVRIVSSQSRVIKYGAVYVDSLTKLSPTGSTAVLADAKLARFPQVPDSSSGVLSCEFKLSPDKPKC